MHPSSLIGALNLVRLTHHDGAASYPSLRRMANWTTLGSVVALVTQPKAAVPDVITRNVFL